MPAAPIVGSGRSRAGVVFTVTWSENGRRLKREFPTRDAARGFARELTARQRGTR